MTAFLVRDRLYMDFREAMEASNGALVFVVIGTYRVVDGVVTPVSLEAIDG